MNEDALVAKIVAALKAEMTPAQPAQSDQPAQPAQPATGSSEPAASADVNLTEKLDHISQQIEEITLNEPSSEVKDNKPKDNEEEPKDVQESEDDDDLSDEEVEKMANILKL